MNKIKTYRFKTIQDISIHGILWFLIFLFLSSASFPLLTGLWENQEVYTLFENQGENEERNENHGSENDESENKAEEFLLFTNFQVLIFCDLSSNLSKFNNLEFLSIARDVLTPPPESKIFTTV